MGEVDTPIREYSESLGISFGLDEKTGRPVLKVSGEPGFERTTIEVLDILNYLKEHHVLMLIAALANHDLV